MQELNAEFSAAGCTVVALSPQSADLNLKMVNSNNLGFDILSDPNNDYAHAMGLRFEVPEQVRSIYLGFGIDLPACNGDQSWTLPIPSNVIVGSDGIILNVNADPDYTRRREPSATLELLKRLVK